jgi:3-hydroxyacyl-CoA dehydrogenase/enoyl-CoA hydratase/3-hydroxybutyryl-CoA epimerase
VGIDVAQKVGVVMSQAFGDRLRGPEALSALVGQGRLGRKSQKGIFLYPGGKKGGADEAVYDLLPGGRARQGFDRAEIAERVTLQMVNEAALCLGEGILRSARDGDVGAVFGLGFPPFRGGPFRWADAAGTRSVLARLEKLRERYGARFTPAPLFADLGRTGARFHRE